MRRLTPSQELLSYLDHELGGRVPPVVRPAHPNRRPVRRAALVLAAVAIAMTGIGVATFAFAQDAGPRGEQPETGSARGGLSAPEQVAHGAAAERRGEAGPEPRRRGRRRDAGVAPPPPQVPSGNNLATGLSERGAPGEPNVEHEAVVGRSLDEVQTRPELEEEIEPSSCCTLPRSEPLSALVLEPHHPPVPPSRSSAQWLAALLAALLALALLIVPRFVHRWRARRRQAVRALRMAIESRRGGRMSNEDRSAAFTVDDYDVLVVADGMGGHIGGARAASIAVETAREYLTRRLPLARDTELVEDLVRSAFARAAEALAAEDAEIGLGGRGVDALRTTLIVAVVTPEQYAVGAQGDGGAWAQRATGINVALMKPAKGDATNIVTASLGPAPEGQVEVTTKRRMKGDLLVVCSDGVADRVGPDFDEALREYAGDATAASEIVRPILDSFEGRPAVFDDNLTLGVLVTP